MYRFFLGFRALVSFIGLVLMTSGYFLLGILFFGHLPHKKRHPFFVSWNPVTVAWLKFSCGLDYQVNGEENLPQNGPVILMSNHESQWETYFLQRFMKPVCTVVKKELVEIPGFGWCLSMLAPIALDRSNPKQAMKHLQEEGKDRIAKGYSILIFPEGSRHKPEDGSKKPYARGAASISLATGAPLVPIAHNSGSFWPASAFIKKPGVISVEVGPAIYPVEGATSKQMTEQAQAWIETARSRMP